MNHTDITKEFLEEQYTNNKKSIVQISQEYKLATMTIYEAMRRLDIPIRKHLKFQIPRDVLYIEYIENKKTIKEISEIFGCSEYIINSTLKKYNIDIRVGKNPNLVSILSKELLEQLYIKEDLKIREIAKRLNFSSRHIGNTLKEFGISRKRKEKQNCQIDLTNQRFGRLLVINLDRKDQYDGYVWNCCCDCGDNVQVLAIRLLAKNNAVKSCGCARAKNCDWKIISPTIWNGWNTKAKKRGLEFLISREYGEELFIKQEAKCALSGVVLQFARRRDTINTTASLDRIDSKIGYIEGNVQWVHKKLNIAKHIMDNQEFIDWCKLVAENHK